MVMGSVCWSRMQAEPRGRACRATGVVEVAPRASLHAFRSQRRRAAIDKKAEELQKLREQLDHAQRELASWWRWWSWWSSAGPSGTDTAAGPHALCMESRSAPPPCVACPSLENTRFEGETKNDPVLAESVASVADHFVEDAFGTTSRAHSSEESRRRSQRPRASRSGNGGGKFCSIFASAWVMMSICA